MAQNLLATISLIGIFTWLPPTAAMAASIGGTSDFQDGSEQGWTNQRKTELITVQSGGQNGPDDRFLVVEATGGSGVGSKLACSGPRSACSGSIMLAQAC